MAGVEINKQQWPLSFQISKSANGSTTNQQQSWTHELYRGPKNQSVRVIYCRTQHDTEPVAQMFLNEPIVGFDMEWNWYVSNDADARLQERVGLIQVACEDKIALFHIGFHMGRTAKELIPPSLRKLIESPHIIKAGVNIVKADFSRLSRWFDLEPKAAFELSHLHNLITYAESSPSKCTRKLYSLANHVETHLGLPLPKGAERMSRWTVHLSPEQRSYAAADAYAGFMLYHCMNAKRMAMSPSPPMPIHGDKYVMDGKSTLIQLQSLTEDGENMTVLDFYQPAESIEELSAGGNADEQQKPAVPKTPPIEKRRKSQGQTPRSTKSTPKAAVEGPFDLVDTIFSNRVFEQLRHHRLTAAKQRRCSAFIIAHDSMLREMARKCPTTEEGLLRIKGIGPGKVTEYGKAWLDIIKTAVHNLQDVSLPGPPWKNVMPFDSNLTKNANIPPPRNRSTLASAGSEIPEIRPPPTLHTGLSFSIADTKLSDDTLNGLLAAPKSPSSDSSSAFENDDRSPSPSRKRKLE